MALHGHFCAQIGHFRDGPMWVNGKTAPGNRDLALRDILRASAGFIQSVYHTRWTYGHKFGQSD